MNRRQALSVALIISTASFILALSNAASGPSILFGSLLLIITGMIVVDQQGKTLWPFVHKSEFDQMRQERNLMKEALRDANAELYKHRQLIAGLRSGRKDVTDALEKIFNRE